MSESIEAIRTRLAGPIEHSHSDHQRAIEDCRALLTAYDGRNNDALSMELQRDQALRELTALRGENERLKRSFAPRYDGNRDIAAVIEHLRFGDADGDDHDAAAAEIERLQSQLTALRRPVVQSDRNSIPVSMELVQRIATKNAQAMLAGNHWRQFGTDEVDLILRALDQAQREIQQLIANHENREDQMEAEIARLSIPPQEHKEIIQFVSGYCEPYPPDSRVPLLIGYCKTLLGDCAAWRNAHALVTAERDEARAKCEKLERCLFQAQEAAKEIEQANRILRSGQDNMGSVIASHVSDKIGLRKRIERLEATLRHISHHAEDPITREIAAQELAAADGQQEAQIVRDAGKVIKGAASILAAVDQPSATGDGVAGD